MKTRIRFGLLVTICLCWYFVCIDSSSDHDWFPVQATLHDLLPPELGRLEMLGLEGISGPNNMQNLAFTRLPCLQLHFNFSFFKSPAAWSGNHLYCWRSNALDTLIPVPRVEKHMPIYPVCLINILYLSWLGTEGLLICQVCHWIGLMSQHSQHWGGGVRGRG